MLSVSVGETEDLTTSGGTTPYDVSSSDTYVATATLSGNTVTITGVAEGTATITISDSASNVVNASVTVTGASSLSVTPSTLSG